jgi:hypothetical protein
MRQPQFAQRTSPRGWVTLILAGTVASYAASHSVLTAAVASLFVMLTASIALWWGERHR